MSLSASQILKNHKEKSKTKKTLKPNFTTYNLHKGMNSSNFYGSIVKSHLLGTQTENHVLSSASRQYDNESNKKFRTRSLNKKDTNNQNPEMVRSEMYEKQNIFFKEVFKTKAEKVPQIQDQLRDELQEKAALQKRIHQLKLMITSQNKTKTKIHLNCNKMMNEIEKLQANTRKVAEQNFNLNIKITKTIEEVNDLQEEVEALKNKNQWTKNRIQEEEKFKKELREYNIKTQVEIRDETKQFNILKEGESKAIKNMSNNYMYQNQLKEEKALLLTSIEKDFNKNK